MWVEHKRPSGCSLLRSCLLTNNKPTLPLSDPALPVWPAAATLAKEGLNVAVYEQHQQPGGRARRFDADGFRFDMGPSWYWMPDVFDRYFDHFGRKVEEFYDLVRLDPSYRVEFKSGPFDVPAGIPALACSF